MKYLVFFALVFAMACSNNKSTEDKKLIGHSSTESKQVDNVSSVSANEGGDGLVGEWELVGVTDDTNGNDQLDPDERSKASKNAMDYMKLNSDGSAVFLIANVKGRYEVKTNSTTGRKHLYLYDKSNFEYSKGFIMSVLKDELHIMHQSGGNSITIWKRI